MQILLFFNKPQQCVKKINLISIIIDHITLPVSRTFAWSRNRFSVTASHPIPGTGPKPIIKPWNQFHSPKNLSMSIAIEATELMELFQWSNEGDIDDISMNRVREELADVVIYCLSMANALELDLTTAVKAKVIANAKKYPVDRFKGKYK